MAQTIITRFAPSPTGQLHIGSLRTALYSYLFARRHGGKFLLRIEDTDRNRFVEGAEEKLQQSLHWAGIAWDNEEIVRQSDCLYIYREYVEKLLQEGKAYHCFCSSERLSEMRKEQEKNKQLVKYDRACLSLSTEEVTDRLEKGNRFVVRFRIPNDQEKVIFDDQIRGKVSIHTYTLDDQIILKSDGFPTYHLANVVDDHRAQVTHIIRGEEWLSSTPKHILLYKAFGWNVPFFAHLPLLLNADRSKLSKRQGDVSVEDYKERGYLPDALINYVALLGWNLGGGNTKEFFTLKELEKIFDIKHVHKAGAIFDVKRLQWVNAHYIKNLDIETLFEKTKRFWERFFKKNNMEREKFDEVFLKKVLHVEQERLLELSEVGEKNVFFFQAIIISKEILRWKQMEDKDVVNSLEKAKSLFEGIEEREWNQDFLYTKLLSSCDREKKGEFFWPLRVALTGAQQSPPPHQVAWVIGKEKSIQRLSDALACFGEGKKNMKKSIRLSMIAAIGKNRELGKNNALCWNIPEDMRYFHTMTCGHVVVMGQKTFEAIGKPLKERINIVLSRDEFFSPQGVFVVRNKKEALQLAYKKEKGGEVFIIGGAMIYTLFLKEAERLYLTHINTSFPEADVFFPPYGEIFTKKVSEKSGSDDAFSYTFFIVEKL